MVPAPCRRARVCPAPGAIPSQGEEGSRREEPLYLRHGAALALDVLLKCN